MDKRPGGLKTTWKAKQLDAFVVVNQVADADESKFGGIKNAGERTTHCKKEGDEQLHCGVRHL
jgi:hypothetical protein